MSRQTGVWSDRARWWTLKRFDTPAARALLMDEGVRNVKAILVAKDGVERGTALVLIRKPRTPSQVSRWWRIFGRWACWWISDTNKAAKQISIALHIQMMAHDLIQQPKGKKVMGVSDEGLCHSWGESLSSASALSQGKLLDMRHCL